MVNDSRLRPGDPGYRAVSVALFAVGIVTFALLYATQPLLPLIARDFHLTPTQASLAVSFSTIGLAAGLPLWTVYADRHGRAQAIVAALIASALLTLLLAIAPGFAALAALRLVQGFTLAGVPATAMTYLGEEVAPSALGGAMGLYIAGNSLGGMSGRIAVGFTSALFGWQVALALLGLLSLALGLFVARALPPSRHFHAGARRVRDALRGDLALFRRKELTGLFAIGGLLMAAFVAVYNYLGFLLAGPPYFLPAGLASLVYLFYLLGSVSSMLLGRLADRVGRTPVLRGSVLMALAGALLTLGAPLAVKLVGLGLFTFGFFGGHAAASTLVSARAGAQRAGASSAYLVAYYVGSSFGGSLIGLLWESLRWPGVVLGAAIALVPALILSLLQA
ncbi:MAG: MFS transporter [Thermaerobacter sp.]|nr:MFS transporter [Thermaerobacter sp.]